MTRIHAGLPGARVEASNELYADGRLGTKITVTPETLEQFRTGYRCMWCMAAQQEPFPERCIEPYCLAPIRLKQMERFEFEFRGENDPWLERETPLEGEPADPEFVEWAWRKRARDLGVVLPPGTVFE